MNVFVAGASGAIGRPLVAELVRRGHAVTGMTRSDAGATALSGLGAAVARVSAFDAPGLERVLRAYDEVHPLADGWRDRIGLHQLHPLVVHVVLFGGSYVTQALELARRY